MIKRLVNALPGICILILVAWSLHYAADMYVEDDRQYRKELQDIEVVGMKARQCGMLGKTNPWGDDGYRREAWNRGFYGPKMQTLPTR